MVEIETPIVSAETPGYHTIETPQGFQETPSKQPTIITPTPTDPTGTNSKTPMGQGRIQREFVLTRNRQVSPTPGRRSRLKARKTPKPTPSSAVNNSQDYTTPYKQEKQAEDKSISQQSFSYTQAKRHSSQNHLNLDYNHKFENKFRDQEESVFVSGKDSLNERQSEYIESNMKSSFRSRSKGDEVEKILELPSLQQVMARREVLRTEQEYQMIKAGQKDQFVHKEQELLKINKKLLTNDEKQEIKILKILNKENNQVSTFKENLKNKVLNQVKKVMKADVFTRMGIDEEVYKQSEAKEEMIKNKILQDAMPEVIRKQADNTNQAFGVLLSSNKTQQVDFGQGVYFSEPRQKRGRELANNSKEAQMRNLAHQINRQNQSQEDQKEEIRSQKEDREENQLQGDDIDEIENRILNQESLLQSTRRLNGVGSRNVVDLNKVSKSKYPLLKKQEKKKLNAVKGEKVKGLIAQMRQKEFEERQQYMIERHRSLQNLQGKPPLAPQQSAGPPSNSKGQREEEESQSETSSDSEDENFSPNKLRIPGLTTYVNRQSAEKVKKSNSESRLITIQSLDKSQNETKSKNSDNQTTSPSPSKNLDPQIFNPQDSGYPQQSNSGSSHLQSTVKKVQKQPQETLTTLSSTIKNQLIFPNSNNTEFIMTSPSKIKLKKLQTPQKGLQTGSLPTINPKTPDKDQNFQIFPKSAIKLSKRSNNTSQQLSVTKSHQSLSTKKQKHFMLPNSEVILIKPSVDASNKELHARNKFRHAEVNLREFLEREEDRTVKTDVFRPEKLGEFGKEIKGVRLNIADLENEPDFERNYMNRQQEFPSKKQLNTIKEEEGNNTDTTDRTAKNNPEQIQNEAKNQLDGKWKRINLKDQRKVGKVLDTQDSNSDYEEVQDPFFQDETNQQETMDTTKEYLKTNNRETQKESLEQVVAKTYTKDKLVYDSSKIASNLPIYFNYAEKHKQDMRNIVRDLAQNGEKMVQEDLSREYSEEFETSEDESKISSDEENKEISEMTKTNNSKRNSRQKVIKRKTSFTIPDLYEKEDREKIGGIVDALPAKECYLQGKDEIDLMREQQEEELQHQQTMKRLITQLYSERMEESKPGIADQRKISQHSKDNSKQGGGSRVIQKDIVMESKDGKKIRPYRYLDKEVIYMHIDAKKKEMAHFREEIKERRKNRIIQSVGNKLAGENNGLATEQINEMYRRKFLPHGVVARKDPVEKELVQKYALMPNYTKEEVDEKIEYQIKKQAVVDNIVLENKKYQRTLAYKKRLWVGEEGRFARGDLFGYYQVYNQTQLHKNRQVLAQEGDAHRQFLQVQKHVYQLGKGERQVLVKDEEKIEVENYLNEQFEED